jgi:hypothetical protein
MEIDASAGYDRVEDIDAMAEMIKSAIGSMPLTINVVVAADWRRCSVFSPIVAEKTLAIFAGANARVERSAILHNADQPTVLLQVLRLVDEGNAPQRKVFTARHKLEQWLGEVLNEAERKRLRDFLRS